MNNIKSTFKTIHSIRKTMAFALSRLTIEQINLIPKGYKNNVIWNAAHIISVQQLLINDMAKASRTEDSKLIKTYKPGTIPEGDVDMDFVKYIQERLVKSAVQMEKDYDAGLFADYTPYETRTKIQLDNAEDAINFELFHEGLHFGYILCLLKVNHS